MRRKSQYSLPVRHSLTAHRAAEPHSVLECAHAFIIKFQGEKKWQTYQFVRNHTDAIESRDQSTFTTPREIRLQLMIDRRSLCAGAALHRINLSATARIARLDSRRLRPLIRRAPSRRRNSSWRPLPLGGVGVRDEVTPCYTLTLALSQ